MPLPGLCWPAWARSERERMNEGALGAVAHGSDPSRRPPSPPAPSDRKLLDPELLDSLLLESRLLVPGSPVNPALAPLPSAELGAAASTGTGLSAAATVTATGAGSFASFALLSLGLHVALYAAATLWWTSGPESSAKGLGDRTEALPLVSVHPLSEAPSEQAELDPEPEPLPPPPWSVSALEAETLPEQELEFELLPALEPALEILPTPLQTQLDLAGRRSRPREVPAARGPTPTPTPVAAADSGRSPSLPTVASSPTSAPARAGSPLRPRSTPTPTLPQGLASRGEARVGLLLYVGEDGGLADVRVEVSSGQPALDEHVRAFVLRSWSFAPLTPPRWVRQGFRVGS